MSPPSLWIRNAAQVVSCGENGGILVRDRASVLISGDRITWLGEEGTWSEAEAPGPEVSAIDASGCVVTAGLVECHTHLLFAGSRAVEFSRRLAGERYEDILAQGGGILSTVRATREASREHLLGLGESRLLSLLSRGVTTVEIKSGYGLDLPTEIRLLETIRTLQTDPRWDLVPTFLGAHTVPAEHRGERERYVDLLVEDMLPRVAQEGLARFCDVFCEREAFTLQESRRILTRAQDLGLGIKIHAEQLSRTGATALAAELGAVSADHLEKIEPSDAESLAAAGVVAVLLPGASVVLRSAPPPARLLRDAGVAIALSTDWNPGTSPSPDLLLMATLGCLNLGLTMEEAWAGITVHAARSLGLHRDRGRVEVGMRADLALFSGSDWREVVYGLGHRPCRQVIKDGKRVYKASDSWS